jgi:hypothetical protein
MIEPIILYGSELWSVFPSVQRDRENALQLPLSVDLDKPALLFMKRILGLPRNAPSSATLLELGMTRASAKGLTRAVNYWIRIANLPDDHIMKNCLKYQEKIIQLGAKPWLYYINQFLGLLGFANLVGNPPEAGNRVLRKSLSQRISDIYQSNLMAEATTLVSLREAKYENSKVNIMEIEPYTYWSYHNRRTLAIIRLNLKYTLPWEIQSELCKMCNESTRNNKWKHFLSDCASLPPLPDDKPVIPFPDCIQSLDKNKEHPYIKRIRMATILSRREENLAN